MIKVNGGHVEYKGSKLLILAEVTTLLHALYEEGDITDDDIKEIAKNAVKSADEIDVPDISDEMMELLMKILS